MVHKNHYQIDEKAARRGGVYLHEVSEVQTETERDERETRG